MQVPLLDLKLQYQSIQAEIDEAIHRVVESQRFILGDEVAALESELAERTGAAHAVGCASGSDALLLSMMARDIGHGAEVITTPFTFFATAGAISRLHAKIKFVDIEPESFNIDTDAVAAEVNENTRALIPVHLFGRCADMKPLLALAARHDLTLIEDACQAIDATCPEGTAGAIGDFGCFSFFPSKNLGGFGDGGAVTMKTEADADRVRRLRTHGGIRGYQHDEVGFNSRLDALQAAILRAKLPHLDAWRDARRAHAQTYRELFADRGLEEWVRVPSEPAEGRHVYNQFTIRCQNRDRLRKHLAEHGVGSAVYYPLPLHLQPCFAKLGYGEGAFPHAEAASREVLSLPVFPELTEAQQVTVVDTIQSFYRS